MGKFSIATGHVRWYTLKRYQLEKRSTTIRKLLHNLQKSQLEYVLDTERFKKIDVVLAKDEGMEYCSRLALPLVVRV